MKYEKYLSWEDGEKYMLDNKAVHKATSMLIMWILKIRLHTRIAELERDVLYKARLWLVPGRS